jgi:hypothetical protein
MIAGAPDGDRLLLEIKLARDLRIGNGDDPAADRPLRFVVIKEPRAGLPAGDDGLQRKAGADALDLDVHLIGGPGVLEPRLPHPDIAVVRAGVDVFLVTQVVAGRLRAVRLVHHELDGRNDRP